MLGRDAISGLRDAVSRLVRESARLHAEAEQSKALQLELDRANRLLLAPDRFGPTAPDLLLADRPMSDASESRPNG